MQYSGKKIKELVAENYVFASVLYYLGIEYYDYEEASLENVCKAKGLNIKTVVSKLEAIKQNEEVDNLKLLSFPVDLLIAYLKHSHYLYIKKDMPFLVKLVNQLKTKQSQYISFQEEIKQIFPLFVEDFVEHIYEEEDTVFTYIDRLKDLSEGKIAPSKFYFEHEKYSMQKFIIGHEVHDDEMLGIMNIINEYEVYPDTELPIKVLFAEMRRFAEKLEIHAQIENEILFPKALMLENQLRREFDNKVRFN